MLDYDTELMLRASRGENAAFQELFDRHYKRAVNIAYRSIGDSDLAEDIAMDAFARIYESRRSFKPTAKFTTYLYRIVVNLSINAAKRQKTINNINLDDSLEIPASGSNPEQTIIREDLARKVRQAVLSLPPSQRIALVLTRYEGFSHREAAEAIGTSVGAIESLLHRAKLNLYKALKSIIESEQ
jgi:RNA polymerase sigma-70 factor (ECF subfamily)